MTHTEAVSPPPKCTVSGLRELERSRHPLEPLWCLGQDNSESHARIGVTAVWPRHRPVMPTSRQPANIPNQRCGAVGSLAVYREEEVTRGLLLLLRARRYRPCPHAWK